MMWPTKTSTATWSAPRGAGVTRGAVSTREALLLGGALALLAFGLVLTTNLPTVVWSFGALGITSAYPFAKRWVSMPQAVLGVAFGLGIPMAFSAVQAQVPLLPWVLMLGNLYSWPRHRIRHGGPQ